MYHSNNVATFCHCQKSVIIIAASLSSISRLVGSCVLYGTSDTCSHMNTSRTRVMQCASKSAAQCTLPPTIIICQLNCKSHTHTPAQSCSNNVYKLETKLESNQIVNKHADNLINTSLSVCGPAQVMLQPTLHVCQVSKMHPNSKFMIILKPYWL